MNETTVKISKLIKSFGAAIIRGGPRKASEIQNVENTFDLFLPSDYRMFLGNYGYLDGEIISIFGLSELDSEIPSVFNLIMMLRFHHPEMPLEVVPVEALDEQHFACIACSNNRKAVAPIVVLNIDEPEPVDQLIVLAPDFNTYLANRLIPLLPQDSDPTTEDEEDDSFHRAWENFEKHVIKYQHDHDYDHAKGGKLPRNTEWRPYRYCIQDVVFGVTVVRHDPIHNNLAVDVFISADVPEYGPLAGSKALTTFLLSEAYKCGGTMEVFFTRKVEDGNIPREIRQLAEEYGVKFKQKYKILPFEAKALYAAITEFSPSLQQEINKLEELDLIRMARACYVIHHGVWDKEQVEMIVLGSERPDSILGGLAQPHQRLLYNHDLHHARAALLGGMLDRIMAKREREMDGVDYDMEDDTLSLEINFDGDSYCKIYSCSEPVPIPWLYLDDRKREIQAGMPFRVLVRARDGGDMRWHLKGDIKQANDLRTQYKQPTLILLPQDFMDLPPTLRQQFHQQAQEAQIGLLICPEPVMVFDKDAAQRLTRSRILRQ